MAILDFQRPDKVYLVESTDTLGNFEFRPLEPGYGLTIGNALRRVLLSSLEGFAITSVKIEGVEHEFSTIKGVVEDVTEMILNLKQIRLKQQIEDENTENAEDDEKLWERDYVQYAAGGVALFLLFLFVYMCCRCCRRSSSNKTRNISVYHNDGPAVALPKITGVTVV